MDTGGGADGGGMDAPLTTTDAPRFETSTPPRDAPVLEVMPMTGDVDGDRISDMHEGRGGGFDTDRDGTEDYLDLDSDQDTVPDIEEAGDDDLRTVPLDSDGDGIPDYLDTDSDNDSVSDADERARGTSPTDDDSDGDGALDLVEIGSGTDPLSASDNPRARGDFVFIVPYREPPTPPRDTLAFATKLPRADFYFLMDNSTSFGGAIRAIQTEIRTELIPRLRMEVRDVYFGVGSFEDYPVPAECGVTGVPPLNSYGCNSGFGIIPSLDRLGNLHDLPFTQFQSLTDDIDLIELAVMGYKEHRGGDNPESAIPALYALATGDSLDGYARYGTSNTPAPCPTGGAYARRGPACFRVGVPSIVLVMTDEWQHNQPGYTCDWVTCRSANYNPAEVPNAPSYAAMISALSALDVRVVGLMPDGSNSRPFLERLVTDTTLARGAVGVASDYVFVHRYYRPITEGMVSALQAAATGIPIDVSARAVDVTVGTETVDAVAAFIDHIETRTTPAPGLMCTTGLMTYDRDGIDVDPHHDSFRSVTPGRPVCFDVIAKQNETVPATREPVIYQARIDVLGDGTTTLDDRIVYFLVPPRIPHAGNPF